MFDLRLQLEKAWQDSAGAMRFRCKASSTALDSQFERMTPQALAQMTSFCDLELRPLHNGLTELGKVESLWVEGNDCLGEGVLDPSHPEAARVWERMLKGRQYGLSVGGKVTAAHWQFDKEAGRSVRFIDAVTLDHVALCPPGKAANPETWIRAVAKSADEEGFGSTSGKVSDAPWRGDRRDLPRSAYLVQGPTWSDCKLPVYEPDPSSPQDEAGRFTERGAVNVHAVRAALAALSGAHTGEPMAVPQEVRERLRTLADQCGIDAHSLEDEEPGAEPARPEPPDGEGNERADGSDEDEVEKVRAGPTTAPATQEEPTEVCRCRQCAGQEEDGDGVAAVERSVQAYRDQIAQLRHELAKARGGKRR